jgi:hypothetical protein
MWRSARGKIVARHGSAAVAIELATRAVSLYEATDSLDLHGNALLDLAEVHRLTGHPDAAIEAARRALDLFEQKGNLVSIRKAGSVLEDLRDVSGTGDAGPGRTERTMGPGAVGPNGLWREAGMRP